MLPFDFGIAGDRSYALTKKVEYVKRGNTPLLINVKWQDNYLNHRQQSVTVICLID
jgi:hypothetical protein